MHTPGPVGPFGSGLGKCVSAPLRAWAVGQDAAGTLHSRDTSSFAHQWLSSPSSQLG
jgi:hypothetical protein